MAGGKKFTGMSAAGVALAMLGLAFASVPLYRIFCQVTGFGGTTQRAEGAEAPGATDKIISVRFDANISPGLAWNFKPVESRATVRIGERKLAFYEATNLTDTPITGMATFNVSPDTAGAYFVKIDCFCFTQQTLQPHQTVQMPVTYYIDPELLTDADARKIKEITLSYTFFPAEADTVTTTQTTAARAEAPATGRQG